MKSGRLILLIDEAVEYPIPVAIQEHCDMPYYALMHLLSKEMSPCVALELGVYDGQGCLALASGSSYTRVYGVDCTRRSRVDNLEEGFPNFTFLECSSLPIPGELVDVEISILHIDTAHTYDQARDEFLLYKPQLADGAVVLFDDLHAMGDAVLRAFTEMPYWKVQDDRLHPSCGYGVLLYSEDKKV